MAFSKVTVAVAATALALLAPAARAEPQNVLRTATAGVIEALEQEVAVATSGDRDSDPELGATYKNILEVDDDFVMTVSSYYSGDKRNSDSYYVCATSEKDKYMKLKFSRNPEYGVVTAQVAEMYSSSGLRNEVVGWYLSVLDGVPSDTKFRDSVRLSVQPDESKATKWYFQSTDERTSWITSKYMRVHDAPGLPQLKDMYLMMPTGSERDDTTKYLAVGPDDYDWPADVELK